MWHQIHSYREINGLVRCIYAFVQGRQFALTGLHLVLAAKMNTLNRITEAWINSLLANGYSLYVFCVTEDEWRTALEREGYYTAELHRLLVEEGR